MLGLRQLRDSIIKSTEVALGTPGKSDDAEPDV